MFKNRYLILIAVVLTASLMVLGPSNRERTMANEVEYGKQEMTVYNYDFGKSVKEYVAEGELIGFDNNIKISNGKIEGNGKPFLFGSMLRLGDDYGLVGGKAEIAFSIEEGVVNIGLRTIQRVGDLNDKGIWIVVGADDITVKLNPNKKRVLINHGLDLKQEKKFIIKDNINEILFLVEENGQEKLLVKINYSDKNITVEDASGNVILNEENRETPAAGFLRIGINNKFRGTIDNFSYEHIEITRQLPYREQREVSYSNWVATDDLGRSVADKSEAGKPQKDKYVGLFYFISFDRYTGGIYDHTKAYMEGGLEGLWKQLNSGPIGYGRYWAEPYFGYYINGDTWIYRKHAYQLQAAGVDFIFLDMSNTLTYPEAHIPLFDTWLQIRKEGGQTPQIVCFTGDNASTLVSDLYTLNENIYQYEKYDELFFKWEGKPLILGNPENLEDADVIQRIKGNKDVYSFYLDKFPTLLESFTVRRSWAWRTGTGYWNWLMESPQIPGSNKEGKVEQVSVALGHHASTSKGRSYVDGVRINNGKDDFEFSSDTARYGLGFESQFKHAMAMKQNPSVMMITGWNEWTAGKWAAESPNQTVGNVHTDFTFVDQFNPEFSRDAEPMKVRDGVGFGDNFYYQMTDYIRQFKGIEKYENASGQKSISLKGKLSQWDNIGPEFRDTIGDTAYRSAQSFGGEYQYINTTGRNDIDYAKVSITDKNIYFLVTTLKDIIVDDGENWMNLFIDYDSDSKTGWEGYDFVLNRSRTDNTVSIERFIDGKWEFESLGDVKYSISGNHMIVEIPIEILGKNKNNQIDFKWADNSTTEGNIMEFMDLGDSAPNDRFNFRYVYSYAATENLLKGFLDITNWSLAVLLLRLAIIVVIGGSIVTVVVIKKKKAKV